MKKIAHLVGDSLQNTATGCWTPFAQHLIGIRDP
jgi:hypothetical protein